jgi:hypothetical protein
VAGILWHTGDVPAAFDAPAEQVSFRAEQPAVFDALQRSMSTASTSAVPEAITAVRPPALPV